MFNLVTNYSAMYNNLKFADSVSSMKTIRERLSSGLQINRGADGPSDLALSEGLKAHFRGIDVGLQNLQEFMTYCEARDRSMVEQMEIALRMRDLAVRAAQEATLTDDDRQKLHDEAQALSSALDNIGRNSTLRSNDGSMVPQHTLFGPGEIDVVWVLDRTGSMGPPLATIASKADDMFTALEARKFDVRMAAFGFGTFNDVTHDTDGDGGVDPTESLGTPGLEALDGPGAQQFFDNAAAFAADVNVIAGALGGGNERGIDATYEAADKLSVAPSATAGATDLRADAQKIFIIITDEDSDDAGRDEIATGNYEVPWYLKNELIAKLDSLDPNIQVWAAANLSNSGGTPVGRNGIDPDYIDVVDATGGQDVTLDNPGQWMTTLADKMQGLGGPYKLKMQYGPDNGDMEELQFKTVTATTTGLGSVSLTTVANAQKSIDTAQAGIDFISNERAVTGHIMNQIEHMIDDYQTEYINTKATNSRIVDTDFAQYGTKMAREQVLMNSAQAIAMQANAMPTSVLNLISAHGM